jgi:hypothetical protein
MIDRVSGANCFPRVKSDVMVAADPADRDSRKPADLVGTAPRVSWLAGLVGYGA